MHIAFLSLEYPPLLSGGIGTSLRNLARALVQQGHQVTVVGWGHDARFDDRGVSVRFSKKRFPRWTGWLASRLFLQQELRRLVRDEQVDLVEAHDWCGLSAGIQPGCPIVVRCHGSSVYFGAMLNEPVRRSVRLAEQTALRGASAVAAVSRFTATETARLFGLQRPVAVLPNGVDLAQFQVPRSGEADPTTLVYVGTIVRKKGVLDLCRAFSRVVVDVPDARLVLLGKDARDRLTGRSTWDLCQAELSEAARRRVEYPGPQPYERVQDFIRRGAACVLPSHAEALPLAWLEAMACAKPVVAYDIGWAPEIVEHERTGLLAPHGDVAHLSDAVVRILRQPAWGTALGRAGRAAIEARFSDQVAAAQSVAWYRQVLDGTC